MNDSELDEMLNQWAAPPVPAELRENVRAGFTATPWWRRNPGRITRLVTWFMPGAGNSLRLGAIAGSVVFLAVMIQAYPHAPGNRSVVHLPWTVDSELIRYAGDGTSSVEMYMTSGQINSNEVLVSRSVPGNGFMTALGSAMDVVGPAWTRFITPLVVNPDMLAKMKKMRSERLSVGFIAGCADWTGCLSLAHYGILVGSNSCLAGKIVGHQTILNHPTDAMRERWMDGTMTVWTAPDLGCFALRVTYEEPQPDGTFKVVRAKQAVKITVNP